jgi:hypothetical protein
VGPPAFVLRAQEFGLLARGSGRRRGQARRRNPWIAPVLQRSGNPGPLRFDSMAMSRTSLRGAEGTWLSVIALVVVLVTLASWQLLVRPPAPSAASLPANEGYMATYGREIIFLQWTKTGDQLHGYAQFAGGVAGSVPLRGTVSGNTITVGLGTRGIFRAQFQNGKLTMIKSGGGGTGQFTMERVSIATFDNSLRALSYN